MIVRKTKFSGGEDVYIAKRSEIERRRLASGLNKKELSLKAGLPAKEDTQSRQFYESCQGTDWEKVVDLDTEALLKCAEEKRPLFHMNVSY